MDRSHFGIFPARRYLRKRRTLATVYRRPEKGIRKRQNLSRHEKRLQNNVKECEVSNKGIAMGEVSEF